MALETLKNITKINGFEVIQLETAIPKEEYLNLIKSKFIIIGNEFNTINFRIQNGPVKENGVNGCQVDELIACARLILEGLNEKLPCRENSIALTKLQEAECWLRERKNDRIKRNVEGENKE